MLVDFTNYCGLNFVELQRLLISQTTAVSILWGDQPMILENQLKTFFALSREKYLKTLLMPTVEEGSHA